MGKEFRTTHDDALFASTPPLEALRCIVSRAATLDSNGQMRELMVNDVSRAYFYAEASRDIYIGLPKEGPNAGPGALGKLELCLYGTRDAAKSGQETLSAQLINIGFTRGVGHPSVFHHADRELMILVHGDDYFSSGIQQDLDWLEGDLAAACDPGPEDRAQRGLRL